MTVVIDYLHGELRSVCSGVLDLQLGVLLLYSFYMFICIYVCLCNPQDTGGRLGVHKASRRLSFSLRPMSWESDFFSNQLNATVALI